MVVLEGGGALFHARGTPVVETRLMVRGMQIQIIGWVPLQGNLAHEKFEARLLAGGGLPERGVEEHEVHRHDRHRHDHHLISGFRVECLVLSVGC